MSQPPVPSPSPQARRQAHLQALREALAQRDPLAMERLLGQWVHRHGHPHLQTLLQELDQADPEGLRWWTTRGPAPAPALAVAAPLSPRPVNAELARLRSWLPDRLEHRRAA